LRFWGVRGSCPAPGPATAGVGGNTSCATLEAGGEMLILDGGTGLRTLGDQLLRGGPVDTSILFSHVHWDHIQGIPFFAPIFRSDTRLAMWGAPEHMTLEAVMRRQMGGPTFPVPLDHVPAQLSFHPISAGATVAIGPFEVTAASLRHPNGVYGYRIEHGGRSIVYATDTEHQPGTLDAGLIELARGADLLIYDAQYTPAEYAGAVGPSRAGWGHSTWREAVNIAQEAKVRQLVLFHHDPDHNDTFLDSILSETQKFFPNTVVAWEGMGIDLTSGQHTQPRDPGERRTGNRQPLHVPLRVQGVRADGTPFEEETVLENLSLGGAYFLLDNDPAPEASIEVEFLVSTEMLFGQSLRTLRTQLVRSHSVKFHNQSKSGVAVMFR